MHKRTKRTINCDAMRYSFKNRIHTSQPHYYAIAFVVCTCPDWTNLLRTISFYLWLVYNSEAREVVGELLTSTAPHGLRCLWVWLGSLGRGGFAKYKL